MTEVVTEVRAQRQLSMERLSGQIEVNMALVHKLTQYVAQAERVRSVIAMGAAGKGLRGPCWEFWTCPRCWVFDM